MEKIYKGAWVVFVMVVAGLGLSGGLGGAPLVVLGMTAFGLIFFGMMLVLPHSITHGATQQGPGRLHAMTARVRTA